MKTTLTKNIFKQITDIDFSKYGYKITHGKSGRTDLIEIRPDNKVNPNINIYYHEPLSLFNDSDKETISVEILHRTNTWCPNLRLNISVGRLTETDDQDFYSNAKELLEKELSLYMTASSEDIFRFIKSPLPIRVDRQKATLANASAVQEIYIC